MPDVFISYSRKDSEFVRRLHEALTATQREAWVDWEDIPVTAEWWSEIARGIEAADSFLFVISPDSVMSKVCNQEIEHAINNNKRLIPIVRREAMSEHIHKALARHNWLYAREGDDFNGAFTQLIEAIDTDLDYVRAHTRLLIRAREWQDKNQDASYLLRGSDLHEAEAWLAESGGKEPKPTEIQTNYILASRRASNRRQRTVLAGVSVALALTVVLALVALALFSLAETRRQESDTRGTAVAHQAATAVAAEATSERRSEEWRSLAWAVAASQALDAGNADLALALALQANTIPTPPPQAQAALVAAAYAPGTAARFSDQHNSWIGALDVSPDGRWLLSGGYDGNLVLWDALTGEVAQTMAFGEGEVMEGGAQLNLNAVLSIAFQPNETGSIALVGQGNGEFHLWDVDAWRQVASNGADGLVYAAAFSPDGSLAVTGHSGRRENLLLWDARDLAPMRGFEGHSDDVTALAFNADGTRLLSGSNDATARLWDVETGDLLQTFGPVTDADEPNVDIRGVVFGQPLNGTPTVITGVNTGAIILWNAETGEEIRRYETGDTATTISDIALSPDGRILASTGFDGILYLWNAASGTLIDRFIGHTAPIVAASFSPDGRLVYTGAHDSTLRGWYVTGGAQARSLRGVYENGGGVASLVLNDDETRAITGGGFRDPAVAYWNLETGEPIRRMEGHSDSVPSLALADDGRLISGAFDGTLRVWDLETGEEIEQFDLEALTILSLVYNADENAVLASVISESFLLDGWAALISLETGEELVRYGGGSGLTTNAIYSPDGTQVLMGGATIMGSGTIALYDAETGELIREFDPMHTSAITTLEYSADGTKVLSGSQDFNAILWDAATGREIRRFVGHTDVVASAHFSPDEQRVVTASHDGTVRLWDASTGDQILAFDGHTGAVRAAIFTADGRSVYSGASDGSLIQWLVTTDTQAILDWLPANRYVRDLTCTERVQYQVSPLCPA